MKEGCCFAKIVIRDMVRRAHNDWKIHKRGGERKLKIFETILTQVQSGLTHSKYIK